MEVFEPKVPNSLFFEAKAKFGNRENGKLKSLELSEYIRVLLSKRIIYYYRPSTPFG